MRMKPCFLAAMLTVTAATIFTACNDSGGGVTDPGGTTSSDIIVKNPTASTVWNTGQTYTVVQWEKTEGDSVLIEVWKGTSKVANFSDWTEDDGYYTRMDAIPASWGDGTNFTVTITDNLGNTGTSDMFTLSSVILPTGMEFVEIPTGSFQMGAPESEDGSRSSDRPVHTVTFNYPFEMMTTEVTQAMWQEIMENNPSENVGDNYPVENVSQYDAENFATAMNLLTDVYHYRLPTEAEWEYCCRANTSARYYWGPDPNETMINDYAWWFGNSGYITHPVGQKLANPWGLFDMCGNVREWCEDNDHLTYDDAPTDGSAWINDSYTYRVVIRGGAFHDDADDLRSAARQFDAPSRESKYQGFRLVRQRIVHE